MRLSAAAHGPPPELRYYITTFLNLPEIYSLFSPYGVAICLTSSALSLIQPPLRRFVRRK